MAKKENPCEAGKSKKEKAVGEGVWRNKDGSYAGSRLTEFCPLKYNTDSRGLPAYQGDLTLGQQS